MRRQIRRIAAAALALALLLGAAALADVKTTGNVYLRKGPGLGYSTITAVPPGTVLEYLGETSVDERGVAWYKVEHNGACWVSSRYATLREEKPRATNAPRPTSAPDTSNQLIWGRIEGQDQGQGAAQSVVELSPYYLEGLKQSAAELSLTGFRSVNSEAPNQYYDSALTIGGYSQVTYLELSGPGYSLFGATVGMSLNEARALFERAGLTLLSAREDSATFEHPGDQKSLFIDWNGNDSCINVDLSGGAITGMSWSTYTG